MLDLQIRDRLQHPAGVPDQTEPWGSRPVLALRWTVDAETGRPISRWEVSEERGVDAKNDAWGRNGMTAEVSRLPFGNRLHGAILQCSPQAALVLSPGT